MKRANKGAQPGDPGQPSAERVERRPSTKGNSGQPTAGGTQGPKAALDGLDRVREAARRDPRQRFTNLLHHVTEERLRDAYGTLKREAAPGVDGVTWKEYGEGLAERLIDLHDRIQSERYRAKPSKRAWLPKPDGRQRPLGIAALEDKIVQQALVGVLQAIYEEDFLGFSYGFRPQRSPHDALDAIYVAITQRKVSWVLDADIRSFYDTIDHGWLMKFVEHRVGDPRVLRLIGKFLRAGVSEDGQWSKTVAGTPQGAVISPILANIYLHYALDLWVKWWRANQARGEVYIVRYADDVALGFQYRSDAQRFQAELKERLKKFSLELHEEKTRLIEFGRFAIDNRKERGEGKPETFDFLGFTHICAKRRDERFTVRRKTIAKRLRAKIKEVRDVLMRGRHRPVPAQGRWLRAVVQGHFNYYGVPGNRGALDTFRTQVNRAWLKALRQRSQKGQSLTWERMKKLIATWIPTAR
ncbi:MAG: group II intron reverse transcriptase/maturase, partial [Coriobacteriia bacterium]|nr:group II intron reverse transcriptase/maturase [Coriobacteriia bacterium]